MKIKFSIINFLPLLFSFASLSHFETNPVSAISISNGSFESGIDPGVNTELTSPNTSSITNWSVTSGDIDYIGTLWGASDGTRSIDLNGFVGAGTLSTTITVSAGDIGNLQTILFDLAVNGLGTKQVRVSLSGFTTSDYTTINATSNTPGTAGNPWTTFSYDFTPTTSGDLTLEFTSLSPSSFGPALDNVRAVPFNFEASPITLIGLLAVYLYRARIGIKK